MKMDTNLLISLLLVSPGFPLFTKCVTLLEGVDRSLAFWRMSFALQGMVGLEPDSGPQLRASSRKFIAAGLWHSL